jgi:predicted porin
MQKKLIALAVAGLASTAAFAQTNVQIYGNLDYGYSYRFDDRATGTPAQAAAAKNGVANSSSQFNGGQSAGNRIGFKGTEDLGNGLKAVFLVEQGLSLDTSSQSDSQYSAFTAGAGNNNSISFTRQAYVGLTGNFGTAIGGRLYTPHYTFMASLDPFSGGTVGQYRNVFGTYDVSSLIDPSRVDNAIAYVSPSFGGFTVTGAFSNNAGGNDSVANNARNSTVYAVLGQYNNGPIAAGLGYHYIAPSSTLTTVNDIQNIVLGGSYDFKVVKLSLAGDWNQINNVNNLNGTNPNKRLSNYLVGVTAPVGKFDIQGSYIFSDGNSAAGGDAQQLALGAKYNLSKRTNFYTAYSWIDNSNNRNAGTSDAGNTGYAAGGNGTVANMGVAWQQGFQIGVRHQF